MIVTETSLLLDQELITAAQHGDTQSYGELVCRYRDGVVGVVYRMCGDFPLAEEAAQEAFIRAWQHLGSYRFEYPFRAWIYRIAVNVALDVLRRDKHMVRIDDMEEEELTGIPAFHASTEEPEETLENKQRAERIRRAVLALPPGNRAALVLREFSGLSYSEIAAVLGIPLGTVMSRLNSARGQLRQSLAGLLEVL